MAGIKKSVGKSGTNEFGDVVLVQLLLNHHISLGKRLRPLTALVADGKISPHSPMDPTVTAIIMFQQKVMGYPKPDGRVDPRRDTMKALLGPVQDPWPAASKPKTVSDPITTEGSDPVRLTSAQAKRFKPGGSISVGISLQPVSIKAGDIFRAVDGDRVVFQPGYESIVFLLLRTTKPSRKVGPYLQPTSGFVSDITLGAAAGTVVTRTASIHTAIKLELNFLMGIAVGICTPAALFNLGYSVGTWYSLRRKRFPKWRAAFGALLTARAVLKRHAPVLYDKVFERAWKSILKNVPAASVSDPDHVAMTTGEILGRFGATGFDGRLAVLGVLWSILYPITKRALLSVPHAVEMSIEDGKKQAQKMIDTFRKAEVIITKLEAEQIVGEVANNAKEISSALKNLQTAFEDL